MRPSEPFRPACRCLPHPTQIAKYLVKLYGKTLVNTPYQERNSEADPPGQYEGETALVRVFEIPWPPGVRYAGHAHCPAVWAPRAPCAAAGAASAWQGAVGASQGLQRNRSLTACAGSASRAAARPPGRASACIACSGRCSAAAYLFEAGLRSLDSHDSRFSGQLHGTAPIPPRTARVRAPGPP